MKAFSFGIIPYLFTDTGIEILLMKSSSGMKQFDFIKGKIENEETPKECCIREIKEEIGISVNINDLEKLVIQKNPKKNIGLFYLNWDKYIDQSFNLQYNEVYMVEWFNVNHLPIISNNQRLILSDIKHRFNKLNFYTRIKR